MTSEEIEFAVRNINAIWGIEGMEMTEAEMDVMRKYFAGELSESEYREAFFSANSHRETK